MEMDSNKRWNVNIYKSEQAEQKQNQLKIGTWKIRTMLKQDKMQDIAKNLEDAKKSVKEQSTKRIIQYTTLDRKNKVNMVTFRTTEISIILSFQLNQ